HVERGPEISLVVAVADGRQQPVGPEQASDRLLGVPPQQHRTSGKFLLRQLRQLDGLPAGNYVQYARRALGPRLRGDSELVRGDIEMPDGDMREIGVRNDEPVPANQSIKPGIVAVGTCAVVRIMQNKLGPALADLERAAFEIGTPGEPDFVHLKALP